MSPTIVRWGHHMLDLENSIAMRKEVSGLAVEDPNIIVDMSRVSYIDTTGMGTLISLSNDCSHRRGRMVVVICDDSVKRIIEKMNLHKVIEYYNELDSAKNIFAQRSDS
jgi:anti-sigma B factor antagonist